MKIRNLIIKNFRGVKELDWKLPVANTFCLIGKGDSSKSTILEAIRYAFYPQWNLALSDSDFYQCNVDNSIVIEVTIGALTEDFYSLNKYGHYLRGWDLETQLLIDEPDDHLESVLTVRLTVREDLEPEWVIVCDRTPEGVPFKQNDRRKISAELIGTYSERQLSWGAGSSLARLTDTQSLNELLTNTSRVARKALETDRADKLQDFDAAARKSEDIAKLLGVPVKDSYKAHLDLKSINLKSGGLSLHDGDIPLRQLGLGSRRMLLCGIQTLDLEEGHITLFDEIELGLEPYRITRLIKHIKEDNKGQYFLTTHSPTVLRELTVKDLYIVHNNNGHVQIVSTEEKGFEDIGVQGKIRSSAEAFLAKKIVVCEGATEIGFLRGLDDFQMGKNKNSLSYHGVALLDAKGGGNVKNLALAFKYLAYDVAVLADGDVEKQFSPADEQELRNHNIKVQVWDDKFCLEERAFQDLPWLLVLASVKFSRDELGFPVVQQVENKIQMKMDENIDNWVDTAALRSAIGNASITKKNSWFKDTTRGELWFKEIQSAFECTGFDETNLSTGLMALWEWIEHD